MKTVIFGVLASVGIVGGAAVGVVNSNSNAEKNIPVEYIEFTEPLEIKGIIIEKNLDKQLLCGYNRGMKLKLHKLVSPQGTLKLQHCLIGG